MDYLRLGLRIIKLPLLAITGLLVIGTNVTQAEVPWKIGGQAFAKLKIEEEKLTTSQDSGLTYLVNGINLEITCSSSTTTKGRLLLNGKVELQILFSQCIPYSDKPHEKLGACSVQDVSMNMAGLQTFHGEFFFLLFEPEEGKSHFLTYKFEGAECPLNGVTHGVSGSFATKLESSSIVQTLNLGDTSSSGLLGDKASLGTQGVSINGVLLMALNGPLVGKTWGAF